MSAELAAPALRYVAIGAAMFAFGRLSFAVLGKIEAAPPRIAAAAGLAASVGAALAWATGILGANIPPEKLAHLFSATFIGKAWLVHIGAAAMLAGGVLGWPGRRRSLSLLAAASLATFAAIGHAAAADGAEMSVRIFLQSSHLLGAGFWIGALPLLIEQLTGDPDRAARAVAAFAKNASIAVAALVAAALANLFFLTGGEAVSFATGYGRTLAFKAGLAIAALMLAAVNRFVLTPQRRFGAIAGIAAIEVILLLVAVGAGVLLALSALWR